MQYFNASETPVEGSARTVDRSTLIWNDGTTFFRLETDLAEALLLQNGGVAAGEKR